MHPPPAPAFTWSGVYVGAQVGYGWGSSDPHDETRGNGLPNFSTSGVVGGGHLGYNFELSQIVFGLEGDVNATTARGTGHDDADYGRLDPLGYSLHQNFDFSIRGRLGYAFDRVLIYGTGGVAYGDFRTSYWSSTGLFDGPNTQGRFGWTVGGGVEYALDNDWSIRAEYRYTDYGRIAYWDQTVTNRVISQRVTDNRVQVGFSYKFDLAPSPAPVVAKY